MVRINNLTLTRTQGQPFCDLYNLGMKQLLLAVVVCFLFAPAIVHAQAAASAPNVVDKRAEIGFFYTGVNLKGFGETVNGLGGRFGYNLNKNFAIDSEFSFFPETHLGNNQIGQKTQALIGIKAGTRSGRFGVFAKARPGAMFIGEVTSGLNCSSSSSGQICHPSHSNFALDVGGVVEVYPTARSIIRFDAGDTIVRIRSTGGIFPLNGTVMQNTTNNFQFSIGFGYRF